MKNKKIIILLIVIDIIIMTMICNFINKNIIKEKQIIKEMSESTQVAELNNQINALNAEHTEYMNYIQIGKTKIATALTNEGVATSNEETLEKMSDNISKVLQAKTADATATAAQILMGETAWVNGTKITGTMTNNGAISKTINAGESYTIPAGYHNGSGKVTTNATNKCELLYQGENLTYTFEKDCKIGFASGALFNFGSGSSGGGATLSQGKLSYIEQKRFGNIRTNGAFVVVKFEDVPKGAVLNFTISDVCDFQPKIMIVGE